MQLSSSLARRQCNAAKVAKPFPTHITLRGGALPCPAVHKPNAAHKSNANGSTAVKVDAGVPSLLSKVGHCAASALLTASLLLGAPYVPAAKAEPVVIRLPASNNPEVFAAQRTLMEAWTIVGETYVDPTFNQHDWIDELKQHMVAAYEVKDDSPTKAWDEINSMLSDLGDPYTRRIEPEDYLSFRVSADGELQGIGLLIANELTSSGHLRVLAPIRGGPADRAGILPGDELVSINGQDTQGWSGEKAASVLRGAGGTEVRVRLARRSDGIPGVPSRPEPKTPHIQYKEVAMRREAVAISPVYSTLLNAPSDGGVPVGYIRLTQFSNNAARDMRDAVASLQGQGAGRYILDLRSNPGGLVKAGVDIAAMWLDGEQPVFSVSARDEPEMVQTTEHGGPALTHAPLVVLVDKMSASASEIVSGALRDNQRAVIMGDSATYGKGRIQSVFELQDGSALFVTVAKYQTPNGSDIDKRGITPDRACRLPALASAPSVQATVSAAPSSSSVGATPLRAAQVMGTTILQGSSRAPSAAPAANPAAASLGQGGAVAAAGADSSKGSGSDDNGGFVPGIPLDPTTEQLLLETLKNDRCVLAAEQYLEQLQPVQESPAPPPLTKAQTLYLALTAGKSATM